MQETWVATSFLTQTIWRSECWFIHFWWESWLLTTNRFRIFLLVLPVNVPQHLKICILPKPIHQIWEFEKFFLSLETFSWKKLSYWAYEFSIKLKRALTGVHFQLWEPQLITEEKSASYKESAVYYFIAGCFTIEPIEGWREFLFFTLLPFSVIAHMFEDS